MALKSLDEFNRERQEMWKALTDSSRPNGIACPKCGKELRDTFPFEKLASCPASKRVHCPACNYSGTRLA